MTSMCASSAPTWRSSRAWIPRRARTKANRRAASTAGPTFIRSAVATGWQSRLRIRRLSRPQRPGARERLQRERSLRGPLRDWRSEARAIVRRRIGLLLDARVDPDQLVDDAPPKQAGDEQVGGGDAGGDRTDPVE